MIAKPFVIEKKEQHIFVFCKTDEFKEMSSFTETSSNREPPCLTRDTSWSRVHRDLQATAMSVDWSGQWVLLAGRFG